MISQHKKSDPLDLLLTVLSTNCKMQFHHVPSFVMTYVGITAISGPWHKAGSWMQSYHRGNPGKIPGHFMWKLTK